MVIINEQISGVHMYTLYVSEFGLASMKDFVPGGLYLSSTSMGVLDNVHL